MNINVSSCRVILLEEGSKTEFLIPSGITVDRYGVIYVHVVQL